MKLYSIRLLAFNPHIHSFSGDPLFASCGLTSPPPTTASFFSSNGTNSGYFLDPSSHGSSHESAVTAGDLYATSSSPHHCELQMQMQLSEVEDPTSVALIRNLSPAIEQHHQHHQQQLHHLTAAVGEIPGIKVDRDDHEVQDEIIAHQYY